MTPAMLQTNITRACAKVHDGQHQAPVVRPWLRVLELEGLVSEREVSPGKYGWKLTRAGIERATEARCCGCEACDTWAASTGSDEEAPSCTNIPLPDPLMSSLLPQVRSDPV